MWPNDEAKLGTLLVDLLTVEEERIDQITMEVHTIPGREPSELDRRLSDVGFRAQVRGKLSSYIREVA